MAAPKASLINDCQLRVCTFWWTIDALSVQNRHARVLLNLAVRAEDHVLEGVLVENIMSIICFQYIRAPWLIVGCMQMTIRRRRIFNSASTRRAL